MQPTIIISRHAFTETRGIVEEETLARRCAAAGYSVLLLPHLYHLAPDSPVWTRLRKLQGAVVLFSWLYPRPADSLLRARGIMASKWQCFDLGTYETVYNCLQAAHLSEETTATGSFEELTEEISNRWYPVIDYSCCEQCRHCQQFCLFGVYSTTDAGLVQVTQPDQCKAGCPACSRICPQGAIIFPLYQQNPAIAGAPGTHMEPDSAARKMYYQRTQTPCPLCEQIGGANTNTSTGPPCAECGRATPTPTTPSAITAEFDSLIDALDRMAEEQR